MQELFLVLGQKSAELMPPLHPKPKKAHGIINVAFDPVRYMPSPPKPLKTYGTSARTPAHRKLLKAVEQHRASSLLEYPEPVSQ